jgi:hypothetical protein
MSDEEKVILDGPIIAITIAFAVIFSLGAIVGKFLL